MLQVALRQLLPRVGRALQQQVLRLQVAVHHAALVAVVQAEDLAGARVHDTITDSSKRETCDATFSGSARELEYRHGTGRSCGDCAAARSVATKQRDGRVREAQGAARGRLPCGAACWRQAVEPASECFQEGFAPLNASWCRREGLPEWANPRFPTCACAASPSAGRTCRSEASESN